MSAKHPIIAITGSSGAGTTTVKRAFEHMFHREEIAPVIVEGDSFHKYDRDGMKLVITETEDRRSISHFGPEANIFDKLEELFKEYGEAGKGERRYYLHNEEEAAPYSQKPGTFTQWEPLDKASDLLFYEGLHGGVVHEDAGVNVAQWVDLLVGVVPIVNLEWIQKIHRDSAERGYDTEVIVHTILRRMRDYVTYITPQFSRTHINFQRVPTVDTSNPFIARDIPTPDESFIVIRIRDPEGHDFPYYLRMIDGAFMSRPNCIVVPGGKMGFAMELILAPMVHDLMQRKKKGK